VLAVRWYLRFSLSYRDVEELLAERGVEADHTTMLAEAASSPRGATRGSPPVLRARHRTKVTPTEVVVTDKAATYRSCSTSCFQWPGIAPSDTPTARVVIAGHALVQNVARGHYELAVEVPVARRVAVAFGELAVAI
jgi:transposase-like protein